MSRLNRRVLLAAAVLLLASIPSLQAQEEAPAPAPAAPAPVESAAPLPIGIALVVAKPSRRPVGEATVVARSFRVATE